MKNLIVLFFIFSVSGIRAQEEKSDVVASNYKKVAKIMDRKVPISKPLAAYSVKQNILSGFSKGNAKILSASFSPNVNISILGKANLYSSSQAQQVLTTFFTQHKVSSFKIEHEGDSGGTKYFIGSYFSGKTKYRVTVNVKSIKGIDRIKSITIEL